MKNISLIGLLILILTNLVYETKIAKADPTEINTNITVPVQSVTKTSVEGKIITVPVETEVKPEFSGYLGLDKNTPLISPKSTDLVVLATEIKIITSSEELQQIVGKNLITKLGEGTSQQQLDRDVQTLLNTGLFADVKVITNANNQGIKITYKAQPIEVRRIEVTGNKVLSKTMIDNIFQSQIGAKISPELLNKTVEDLQKWYIQNGYVLAKINQVLPQQNGTIKIDISEGVIGDVKINFVDKSGKNINGRTKKDFILAKIQSKAGTVFNGNVAQKDLQKLANLGLFEKTEIGLNESEGKVNITYQLREIKSRRVNLGGGYNDDIGLYGLVSFTDANFNGMGNQLGTNLLLGTLDLQLDGRFTRPYRMSEPDVWGMSINGFRRRGLSQTFDDTIKLINGEPVREGRIGGGIRFINAINNDWQTSLGINYTRISIRDGNSNLFAFDSLGNPLSFSGTGIDDLFTFSASFSRDKRDNLYNPSTGSIITLSSEQSLPIGLGKILMNRLQGNYSQYLSTSEDQVLAFNLQIGTVIGDLPPYETFNLGGVNTVRGYGIADLSSGRSYILGSTEYRFPLFEKVGGVFFVDFGSDLGSSDSVLGQPGVIRNKPGIGFGYGTGIRLDSPLGVIRADFGMTDQGDKKVQFGFGQKF